MSDLFNAIAALLLGVTFGMMAASIANWIDKKKIEMKKEKRDKNATTNTKH